MSIGNYLKATSALFVAVTLVGCVDPQVGVRRTGSGNSADGANRVAPRPTVGVHVVQKGETLYAISFKYTVDFRDVARWNNIIDPFTIYPNQRLTVRDPSAAPILEASAPRPNQPVAIATNSGVVVATIPVQTDGASQAINGNQINAGTEAAAGNGVTVAALGAPEPLANAQPLNSAQSPSNSQGLPTGFTDSAAPLPQDTTSASIKPAITPAAPAIVPEAEIVAPVIATVPGIKPVAGRNGWGWPVQGKLIATFASADPGRQGIDIAGNFGDAVYAANAGEVVYSGRGIIGYGELIVIKHDDATLTAYGHNRKRLVSEGQRIKQGETIAEMGKDPQGRALLHFELRRNGKPLDPLGVLPARAR
jgi:lipoprotein NlpD